MEYGYTPSRYRYPPNKSQRDYCLEYKLPLLEQRIKGKIRRVKSDIHPAHKKMYIETLKIEIETLIWVLKEITSLSNNPGLKQRQ
jgi:hypothetical protein